MEKRGNCLSKFNSSQGFEKIKDSLSKNGAAVHFVGVGGISMYSLFNFTRLGGGAGVRKRQKSLGKDR